MPSRVHIDVQVITSDWEVAAVDLDIEVDEDDPRLAIVSALQESPITAAKQLDVSPKELFPVFGRRLGVLSEKFSKLSSS